MEEKKRKYGTDEGSKKGGATTRAKFFPYEGTAVYVRTRVDAEAAAVVRTIPETDRSRFLTEAVIAEDAKRRARRIEGNLSSESPPGGNVGKRVRRIAKQ